MEDYQIEIILENRRTIEGLVISALLKDLTLFGEYKLSVEDFILDKAKYLFSLGRYLSKSHSELDEISVANFLSNNKSLEKDYESFGGWETIKELIEIGNPNNIEVYIDDLAKNNFLIDIRKKGINVTDEIELYGQKFSPFYDKFGMMTLKEIESFYEGLLSSCSISSINQQVKAENLLISEEDMTQFESKIDSGIPYDIMFSYTEKEIGLSDSEEIKYVYALPTLSGITNGFGNGGGSTVLAGFSGNGKSTLAFFDMILPMWYRGEKCLIFSNELKSKHFKTMLYCFIANNIFKYHKLTRKKIDNGDWNEEEKNLIRRITKFLQDRDFDNFVTFIKMDEFSLDEIIRCSKKYITHFSYGCMLIDTWKAEDSSSANYTGQMVENIKRLEDFGNKWNIKVLLTMQLVSGTEMKNAYLTASDISECKATKTCSDLLFLIRKVANELELDEKNKKFWLKPYRLRKSMGDKWVKSYITFTEEEKKRDYRLLFLNKSRRGEDDVIILLQFQGHLGYFTEVGRCEHCHRGSLTTSGKN